MSASISVVQGVFLSFDQVRDLLLTGKDKTVADQTVVTEDNICDVVNNIIDTDEHGQMDYPHLYELREEDNPGYVLGYEVVSSAIEKYSCSTVRFDRSNIKSTEFLYVYTSFLIAPKDLKDKKFEMFIIYAN